MATDLRLGWRLAAYGTVIRGDAKTTSEDQVGSGQSAALARRLTACWNACHGMATEELELQTAAKRRAQRKRIMGQPSEPLKDRASLIGRTGIISPHQPQFPTGTEAGVVNDIIRRQQFGIKKYGVTVAENPLTHRQWLQHAYEEALDLAVYLKRSMEELDNKS